MVRSDMIFGTGSRNGDADINLPFYNRVSVGIAREFLPPDDPKPMTIRFDIVNLPKTS